MKNLLFIFIFCLLSLLGYGQSKSLVIDAITKETLPLASGAYLNKSDSSIIKTFQSDLDGFVTSTIPGNKELILQVKFVGYKTYSKIISGSLPDTIKMVKDGILLNQVQINAEKIAVQVKNDTIQFNAGAFNVKPNDVAEDLLKKLPGVQVETDGTVKAQGETINKITVDGKPFFGTDPKMATKNIPADAIDKVEIFDRKSDQATFSGFDDGSAEKSINFTLKPDKKKAKFGRVEAGYGTKDRYESSFTYFNFNNTRQISILGMSNNANKSGFTMEDASSFMNASGAGAQGGFGGGGGGRGFGGGGGGFGGLLSANTLGINQNSSGGINFKDNFGKKVEFTGSYFLGSGNSETQDKIFRENFVPGNPYFSNIESSSSTTNLSHRFNFSIEYKIDSSNSIKFEPNVTIQNNTSNSLTITNNYKNNIDSLSNSRVSLNEDRNSWRIGGQFLFRHKFKADGRTLSVSVNPRLSDSKATTYNISRTKVFDNSFFKDTTNYEIINDQTGMGFNSNVSYTEPLSKTLSLESAYSYNFDENARDRNTNSFNEADQDYTLYEGLLSNNFKNDYATHRASLSLQIKKLKYQITFTGAYQHALLSSESINENKPFSISFNNILPSANARFNFSKTRSLNINYNTNTRQPSIDDIQPIPDLSDPLHIKIGNPDLGQEFTHTLRANYRSFDMAKNQFMSIFIRGDYTLDKIVTNSTTSFFGAETSRKLNADGYFSGGLYINFGMPYKKFNFNVGSNNSYRREISFINDEKNLGDIYTNGLNLKAIFNPNDKMEYSLGGNASRTVSTYSLQTRQNSSYNDLSANLSARVELPYNFRIESDASFTQRSGLANGFNQHFTIWNASITKAFLSNKAFEITIKGYDLLNENIAVNRNTTSTYVEDVNSLTLGNYFMLTARYYINRPKNNMPKGADMQHFRMRGGFGS